MELTFKEQMNRQIGDLEKLVKEWLDYGLTPTLIIAKQRSIDLILEHLEIDIKSLKWNEPNYIVLNGVSLQIIRTMDLSNGEIIIK